MKPIALFLILLFGITWSVGLWVAGRPAPTDLSGFLAAFLPQVWAPTVIALTIVGVMEGMSGVRNEIRRLSYKRGTGRWLILAALFPAAVTCFAVFTARA